MNKIMISLFVRVSGLTFLIISVFLYGCSNNSNQKKQLDKGELYYNNTVSQKIVDDLGNYINTCEVFTDGVNKGKLVKKGSTYDLSLSVPQDKINDSTYLDFTEVLASQLSDEVFNHSPVKIHLTDENFNTKATRSSSSGRK